MRLSGLLRRAGQLLGSGQRVDEELFQQLEDALLAADVGPSQAWEFVEELRTASRDQKISDAEQLKGLLRDRMVQVLREEAPAGGLFPLSDSGTDRVGQVSNLPPPMVVLVVGVNGTGKTTSIGKLAHYLRRRGYSSLVAAADTFRAAATDQLRIWAERAGADIVAHKEGADPAAVTYDAIEAARARGRDFVIVDTAGRLHTKSHLMAELEKVRRVVERALGRPPDETLLVLDATTGQNALRQAEVFKDVIGLSGVVLAKMDGTAKGGAALSVTKTFGIPIKFLGVGEGIEDLEPFAPAAFAAALFE